MNKRIEELAQCNERILNFFQTGPVQRAAIEEFAELIVRECIGIVENISPGYADYRNQIEDAFRRDCVEKVKEHFGVEE
jgi:hypothetical protein